MSMPILPGLMGANDSAPEPTTLADIISQLDDDQVTELVAAAEAAGFTDDAAPAAADDVNPDLDQPEQPVAGLEGAASDEGVDDSGESAESTVNPDAEPASDDDGFEAGDEADVSDMETSMGVDAILASATSAFDGLDDQLLAITGYQDQATDNVDAGADPDSIEQLAEKAQEVIDGASDAVDACTAAAKADDAHAAAEAAMLVLRAQRILAKLVEQAATYADVTTAPEPGPQDDPAVKLWAQHMAPKTGLLGSG